MPTKNRQLHKMTFEMLEGVCKTFGDMPNNEWIYNIEIVPERNILNIFTTNGSDSSYPEAYEVPNIPLNFKHPDVWEVIVPCLQKRFYFYHKPTDSTLMAIAKDKEILGGSINTIEEIRSYFSVHKLVINYPPADYTEVPNGN